MFKITIDHTEKDKKRLLDIFNEAGIRIFRPLHEMRPDLNLSPDTPNTRWIKIEINDEISTNMFITQLMGWTRKQIEGAEHLGFTVKSVSLGCEMKSMDEWLDIIYHPEFRTELTNLINKYNKIVGGS